MKLDKKTVNNRIKLILSKGIGKAFICDTIDENNLNVFLKNNGFK
jgi:3-dehydroquinate synthetase